jgi:hypothetical protein
MNLILMGLPGAGNVLLLSTTVRIFQRATCFVPQWPMKQLLAWKQNHTWTKVN